MPFTNIYYR